MVGHGRGRDRSGHQRRAGGPRPGRRLQQAAAAAVVALAAAGCTADWDAAPVFPVEPPAAVESLRAAEDCDDVAGAARSALEAAAARMWSARDDAVRTFDEDVPGEAVAGWDMAGAGDGAADVPPGDERAGSVEREAAGTEVIGTNTQEADVDEADIVKTDGRRIVTITDGVLRVVELDGSPEVDGTLDLGDHAAAELFLRGDDAVVIGSAHATVQRTVPAPLPGPGTEPAPMPEPLPFPTGTTITIVSLADPTTPTVTATASVEGSHVAARMVGTTVRLVVRGEPQVATDVLAAPDPATAREVAASVDGEELLPRILLDGRVERLGGCSDVLLLAAGDPDAGSFAPSPPLATITTLTVGDDLEELHPVTIQGAADTVYASTGALYVAATRWDGQGPRTEVHRFDTSGDGPATHTGSGVAPGRLLNQFSLSEREGALRVVTTVDGGPTGMSGRLTVLDTEGDTLDAIGHLDGLGPGEEVKSVRFVGDLGYVVTFRTTDPLYALDLSDARNPRLLGELKIPGFSQYLHPVGDGLLLGVGRDADPRTGMTTGLKVSLFDVRDPAAMAELDQLVLPGASSPVGDDHRAFLWDAGRDQAVVPVDLGGGSGPALVLRVSGRRLERVAELRHGDAVGVTPLRAFVVDGDLWTLSRLGLGRTPADAPGAIDHIGF